VIGDHQARALLAAPDGSTLKGLRCADARKFANYCDCFPI
jgi:hypothetical protein